MIEVYRYVESDAYFDTSVLWAIGATASDSTWTLRTCRIDGRSTGASDGRYRTGIWQTEYRMDIATGRSTFQAEDVRGVMCDHWLGADPPW